LKGNTKTALLFLAPNLLGFFVFTAGPVLFAMAAAFTNWDITGYEPLRFVGIDNFRNILGDKGFWLYLVNTIYFLLGLPISMAISLWVANLLSQKIKGVVVYRTLLYLPSVTSGVATMLLWKALYNPEFGPVNAVLEWFFHGIGQKGYVPPNWLSATENLLSLSAERVGIDTKNWGLGAREAIILMGLWGSIGGGNMLLYLAAMMNVPAELVEAAELDGAGKWKTFLHVTWPQLAPTTFFITIMGVIGGLQGGFEQARLMTEGGPAGTTTTLSYYIYNKAFVEYQMGYACAVAMILFVLILGMTAINWKFGNKEVTD
jgi:multiple sugar transport system permease protein